VHGHEIRLRLINSAFGAYLDKRELQKVCEGDQVILCTAVPSWTDAVADETAFYKLRVRGGASD
jgi:hypothetical protein